MDMNMNTNMNEFYAPKLHISIRCDTDIRWVNFRTISVSSAVITSTCEFIYYC